TAILRAARAEGVDPELAFGLVRAESGFREALVSPRGAVGLTQILPSTAAALRPGVSRRDLLHRDTNLRLGFRYLRELIGRYDGDVRMALHAYHRGPGTVARMRAEGLDPEASFPDRVLQTPLDGADLERITRSLGSDGDRARLLTRVAGGEAATPGGLSEVVRAADAIGSDGDRASVLSALIAQRDLPESVRHDVLRSAARIGSDGNKASVLLTFLDHHGVYDAVAPTFFATVDAIGSDGDHHRVLSAVARRSGLSDPVVRRLLQPAARIGSDGEKAAVLEEIARRGLVRGDALRDAYVRAAGTIGPDTDRARALSAVLAPPPRATAPGRAPAPWNRNTDHQEVHDDRTTRTVRIEARNVVPTPDDRDVAGFLSGGSLWVEESAGGVSRSLRITPGDDGGLQRTYRVNGEAHAYDATARAWLASILKEFKL
ncbi:MAG TPA: transglycosylase SLT domain-containing protein, partial [Longimicrobiaceae bacterium]|nr:transglycosylase SLT domain-containing protein [Longimicrobiaceae bacterium]